MPIPNDYRAIVDMLAEKTEGGKVFWRKDKFSISVTVDKSKFSIWAGNDEHTDQPFVAFALHDSSGTTLDSWYVDEGDIDYSVMQQFFSSAKRHANGVPTKLKELQELIANAKEVGDSDEL